MVNAKISALTGYTPAVNTDVFPIVDTTTATTKKITWADTKATLKTYFDTLYPAETVTTIKTALGITTLSGANTGDNTVCTSGTATTAATLATPRAINGVNFDGSAPITVTVDGNNISGTTLKSTVVDSSLTSVGTLTTLSVDNVTINGNDISSSSGNLTITPVTGSNITLDGTITIDAGVITGMTSINGIYVGRGTNSITTNTAIGTGVLSGNNSADGKNTGVGYYALNKNTTGFENTAVGYAALNNITNGLYNVALGAYAGKYANGIGEFYVDNQDRTNTAGDKAGALLYGVFNATPASQTLKVNGTLSATAFGIINEATISSNSSDFNTKIGYQAGLGLIAGAEGNTFVGVTAGKMGVGASNAADYNTGIGWGVLEKLTTGNNNTSIGTLANTSITTGIKNTTVGTGASANLVSGNLNTAIGYQALYSPNTSASTNTAIGALSLSQAAADSSGNVALGYFAGCYEQGSNAFYVDNQNRTNTAGDKAGALMYGVFNATAASQTLTINAAVNALVSYAVAGTKVVGAQVASIGLDAKSDANKITDIIAALRAHGLLGANA